MAAPKVFVSSTCFDLAEIREQLTRFIRSYGFEPVLSENGDVFYKPDCHTHESCIHEVSNCQLFILIIGGRFGGEYVADKTKSITNAEYLAARQCNLPIFTYVRAGVLANHHLFQQNRKKSFVAEIDYPAIEKQEYALDIFKFIDEVRKNPLNNAIEGFVNYQGLENHLRKQWAGLFFDLLRSREIAAQMNVTNRLISAVQSSSEKLEELVKSLYISSNRTVAEKEIAAIESVNDVELFFESVLRPEWLRRGVGHLLDLSKLDLENAAAISPENMSWDEYLIATGLFELSDYIVDEELIANKGLKCLVTAEERSYFIIQIDEPDDPRTPELYERGVRSSSVVQRAKALAKVFEKYSITKKKRNG